MPQQRTAKLWVERTPETFLFDVKAFRLFTHHPTPPASLPKDIAGELPSALAQKRNLYLRDIPPELTDEMWHRFEQALLPLDSTGKLGIVLFQFPPWFQPYTRNFEYLRELKERLPQFRTAIEFRSAAWLAQKRAEETIRFLRQNDFPFVCVDEPQGMPSSVPPVAKATSSLGVVRFHGRNREMWEKKGASVTERFNYLYPEGELQEWVPKIKELSAQTNQVHVLFNNCYQDKAVVNARQMAFLLD
jgi:uncharacterized protein YecE (DUF72 family)